MPLALPQGPVVVFVDSAAPTTAADAATLRARRGHLWVSDGPEIWVCVDPANGAAVWKRVADAEDLAAIAYSGSWNDLTDTPTTLSGYGITDAALSSDLADHENDAANPHSVTYTQVGAPPDTRTISAGTGLDGGGDLTADRTLSLTASVQASLGLADTAVQPGDLADVATSGSWADISGTPTTLAGYGITDAATDADLTAHEQDTNNPHGVTASQVGAPPNSRTISTGTGLTGGGNLTADRTLSLSQATQNSLALADTAVQPGDLAAVATSGDWADISGTPTTLGGYGITDAALASDLSDHEGDTSNPHGVTYTQVGAPPATRQVTAGTGLTGGGDLTADRSFALTTAVQASLGLADTAVQPGDLAAVATSGSWSDLSGTPTTLAGYGITDAALASDLTSHENNTNNPHGVTAQQVGAPPTSRTITAGTGLTGGGNLSANRTISLSTATQNRLALADTAVQPGDLAAIATSGAWSDLSGTPTTLVGYGIADALARASNLADLNNAATARSNLGLGSAAVENASAFDAAGSAAAVAGDLLSHEQDTNNPHAVTYAQVGADPSGSAAAAESNANSYTDSAISALGSAAHEHVGTQPFELPRNTELASGAFAPYEPLSLYPITPAAAHTLTPDDSGKIVWSAAHDITLPDSAAPGMQPGWRVWVKNTDGVSSLTIDCDGSGDAIDGGASLSLAAGESVLIVMIANGQFGSL